MPQKNDTKFGTIEMTGKDVGVPPQQYNRIACDRRGQLLLLSLVAESHNIKRIRACLLGGAKVIIMAAGAKIKQASESDYYAHHAGKVLATEDGYEFYRHKLGYGMEHALFITRMPGFMRVVNSQAVWNELQQPRFTTPLLREWMPYIEKQLREKEYLTEAYTFGCECGILTLTTAQLDEIVEKGIKDRQLRIPSSFDEQRQLTA
jgi:hypothetical protein